MPRKLTFEYIADNRFKNKWGGNGFDYLEKLDKQLKEVLLKYDCLQLEETSYRVIHFPKTALEDESIQIRKRYFITKKGRKLTWNDVYALINSVEPGVYELV